MEKQQPWRGVSLQQRRLPPPLLLYHDWITGRCGIEGMGGTDMGAPMNGLQCGDRVATTAVGRSYRTMMLQIYC